MKVPPLGPGGEDITWPDQVTLRGRRASSTRKVKPQTSNLMVLKSICFQSRWAPKFKYLKVAEHALWLWRAKNKKNEANSKRWC